MSTDGLRPPEPHWMAREFEAARREYEALPENCRPVVVRTRQAECALNCECHATTHSLICGTCCTTQEPGKAGEPGRAPE